MPATSTVEINLLGSSKQELSPVGRMITWITTYGRYIMITTEMIVLIAFISRFSLDRQLTDLKDEISQKQDIIAYNQGLEITFKRTQDSLNKIKVLLDRQSKPTDTIQTLHTLLPSGTYFQTLSINNGKVTAQITSLTVQSFSQLLLNLNATKSLKNIEIGTIDKATSIGIQYTLEAELVGVNTAAGKK